VQQWYTLSSTEVFDLKYGDIREAMFVGNPTDKNALDRGSRTQSEHSERCGGKDRTHLLQHKEVIFWNDIIVDYIAYTRLKGFI
jgi:hypothetical protein